MTTPVKLIFRKLALDKKRSITMKKDKRALPNLWHRRSPFNHLLSDIPNLSKWFQAVNHFKI